jgi:hypothetical protein
MKTGILLITFAIVFSSCIFVASHVIPYDFKKDTMGFQTDKTTKVNLNDGSIVIFNNGCIIRKDSITGIGLKYNITLETKDTVYSISKENISNIQYYERRWQYLTTLATLPLVAIIAFGVLLAIALSGGVG